jgi:hypothetical protein
MNSPAYPWPKRLDQAIICSLFALAFAIPHSIAIGQAAWIAGLVLCGIRWIVNPTSVWRRDWPLTVKLLLVFVGLTILSSVFSYEPMASISKLRSVGLFTIVFITLSSIPSRHILRLLVITLIASCMINVLFTIGARIIGRGVKIQTLTADSPLRSIGILEGDIILEVNGESVRNTEAIEHALSKETQDKKVRIKVYRYELTYPYELPREKLLSGETVEAKLGINRWRHGRDWRASGFYGHYMTYAELLQLIGSLVFGLLVSSPFTNRLLKILLTAALIATTIALLLSVTRGATLAFITSSLIIVSLGASRRALIIILLSVAILIPIGLLILRNQRNVGFLDKRDASTTWRLTVYKEGLNLLFEKPRHLLVGVGMESIGKHWREWGLFDNGKLPISHMHNNLLQLAVDRGIPATLMWIALLFTYARMLLSNLKHKQLTNWIERGLTLGSFGGLIGFFITGMVQYNIGDSEVAMVFYFIMGLNLYLERCLRDQNQPIAT